MDTTFKPPPTLKSNVQTMDTVQEWLGGLHKSLRTWRRVSIHFNAKIPAGTLCAIAKGREPKKPEYREILGLPLLAPAPVCPAHGIVHCYDCATEQVKPRTNHRPRRKRTPPIRIGEATDDEMAIIKSLTPDERRARLVGGGRK